MPGMGERAYVYAKTCGIIGRSFLGKRIPRLSSVNRLSELDRLVFPDSFRDLPERELLVDLERRILGRSVGQILNIVNAYKKPPELLIRLLRAYEYADLKSALIALAGGERTAPEWTPLERFSTVHFGAYPDLKAMLKNTEFEFLLEDTPGAGRPASESAAATPDGGIDSIRMQTKLDRHYYTALWKSLLKLPKHDRDGIGKILEEEISLRNVIWTLRLRTYYRMEAEDVREHLVFIEKRKGKSLAQDALDSLELPLDTRPAWEKWRRGGFLNREVPDEHWTADPRYFQNVVSVYLYRMARLYFRRRPVSMDTPACFIKLKQYEEDLLTSMAEGLGLGLPSGDVFSLLELEA
ncbi:MAG: V-type ATPase subunit [Treponema sp.]|jgi:vacuolar-type H+-ATPase subunit C/Vma6|nr:V-type ATPase subunit [Treponema sp.]